MSWSSLLRLLREGSQFLDPSHRGRHWSMQAQVHNWNKSLWYLIFSADEVSYLRQFLSGLKFLTQISGNDLFIGLYVSRCPLSYLFSKIQDNDSIGNAHSQFHSMFHKENGDPVVSD